MNGSLQTIKRNVTKGILFILVNTLLWGISPWVIRQGLKIINPVEFLFYRFFWVTIIAFFLYKNSVEKMPLIIKNKKLFFSALAFNFLTLLFYFYGLSMLTAVQAGVLAGTTPLFVIIPLLILGQESMDLYEILGVVTILSGYFIVLLPGLEHNSINYFGVFLLLMGNLLFAISVIINKKMLKEKFREAFELLSYLLALLGFGIFDIFLFIMHKTPILFSFSHLISWPVLYMAIAGSFIAVALFNKAVIYLEASEAISFSYSQPLFLLLWEIFVLHAVAISKYNLVGILLLFFGTIINIIGIYKEHYDNSKRHNKSR